MAQLTRAQLKALWIQGFTPLAANYDDSWDSFVSMLGDETIAGIKTFEGLDLAHTDTSSIGIISKDGNRFMHDFSHPTGGTAIPIGRNVFFGVNSGNFTIGSTATAVFEGSNNVGGGFQSLLALTIGYDNMALGASSMTSTTTGNACTAMGVRSLLSNTTGFFNVAVGGDAGRNVVTANSCIFIGFHSGYYATNSNCLYISSLTAAQQVDEATAKTKAIIYGEQSTTTTNQRLRINADLQLFDTTTYLSKDGSNNMTFTDAVTGTRTLAELAEKPAYKSGTTQANAGAAAGELWVDTANSNVVRLGT